MTAAATAGDDARSETPTAIPREPLDRLFLRFLRFGLLAWGGPVAQIAMLRQTFVDEERWVPSDHFNRVLALYQVLPGPEAHELCVYFGMLSRGRVGGVLAGLGFMLPGLLLMLLLSWLYVRFGLETGGTPGFVFAAMQAAVAALIVRAVHRIGSHVLEDFWLWMVALAAFVAQLLGVHFAITLVLGGALYVVARRHNVVGAFGIAVMLAALAILFAVNGLELQQAASTDIGQARVQPGMTELLVAGLKAGLLTFGGAYTAIPLLQRDAVAQGGWMTNAQFLDGLALSGLLPAPLIIFATFVGYVGGGLAGAVLMTIGVFLPAFAMTLIAHEPLERVVHHPRVRTFLTGLMAAVVGLIAGTTVSLLSATLSTARDALVFALALAALFRWNSKALIPLLIAAAAAAGWAMSVL